ncbi:hypothetical protein DFH08DRAFT_942798 [Mycena albidolilacea]|uniref:Uncharacterized protein n=1 Tax=Mycena albidolilacea TaxID=1033008 RepID=A0AAD6ZD30_9AGAR|nr:hypothetical protein DFH08DRAFT_942798 [Mycena albidolilacea]
MPFPYLATREDWLFQSLCARPSVGRLGEKPVGLEGLAAGQTLSFSLLLWSASALTLQALAQPGSIDVGFLQSDIFGAAGGGGLDANGHVRGLTETYEAATFEGYYGGSKLEDDHASLEPLDALPHPDAARVVRLDGEVRVPASRMPCFRYKSMARESPHPPPAVLANFAPHRRDSCVASRLVCPGKAAPEPGSGHGHSGTASEGHRDSGGRWCGVRSEVTAFKPNLAKSAKIRLKRSEGRPLSAHVDRHLALNQCDPSADR